MSEQTARRQHLLATLRAERDVMPTKALYESCPRGSDGYLPGYTNVYADLRALEKRGLIESMRMDGVSAVFWRAVLSADEAYRVGAEIERLEAIWSLT